MCLWRSLGFSLLLAQLGAGCAKRACPVAAAHDAAVADRPVLAMPDAGADASPADGALATLIVAGERGLREISADGHEVRTIARSPGHHPRWVGPRDLVMLEYRGHGTSVSGLRRVALDSGQSERVARLPAYRCPDDGSGESRLLTFQAAEDFRISADGRFAYLQLSDGNLNVADVLLNVRIELRNGRANLYMPVGKDTCSLPGLGREFAYAPRKRPLAKPGDNVTVPGLPGFELEVVAGLSPSGNWALLSGNEDSSDSIYRTLILLDRRDGRVYPLRRGPWPNALEPAQLQRLAKGTEPDMMVIVGETDLRWVRLGDQEGLIIDQMLIRPGQASVALDGDVVD